MNILRRKAARREITLRISLLFPSPNITNFRSGKDLGKELAFFFSSNHSDTLTFTTKHARNMKVIVILILYFYFDFKC